MYRPCFARIMTSPALTTISLTLALATSDPDFLAAVDSLYVPEGEAPLVSLRADSQAAIRCTAAWWAGIASGRQMSTVESRRATRAAAHRDGLPVVGGGL